VDAVSELAQLDGGGAQLGVGRSNLRGDPGFE
jgi:hypothetical protein